MPNEVEVKFRAENLPALIRALKRAGFKQITRSTHELNTLYDLAGQKLRKRGELLRLRKYGENWVLTHKSKGKTGRHKIRVELETRVENGQQLNAILRALGYAPTFRYEKYRAEWSDGRATSYWMKPRSGISVRLRDHHAGLTARRNCSVLPQHSTSPKHTRSCSSRGNAPLAAALQR